MFVNAYVMYKNKYEQYTCNMQDRVYSVGWLNLLYQNLKEFNVSNFLT